MIKMVRNAAERFGNVDRLLNCCSYNQTLDADSVQLYWDILKGFYGLKKLVANKNIAW